MHKTLTVAVLSLLGATSSASAQCLVESYQQDGGTTQGRLVTAGANRVGIASSGGPSGPSVSVSELDADGHSIAATANFAGSVCAIDADGTKHAVSTFVGSGVTAVTAWEGDTLLLSQAYTFSDKLDVAITTNSGGDWLAVGRPETGTSGVVDLYNRPPGASPATQFTLSTTLTAPAANSPGMRYGHSVAMSGVTLAASAPGGDQGAPDGGHFYAYRWNGSAWAWNSWWVGTTPDEGRHSVLATNGNSIIAGTPFADDGGTDSGHITFFNFDGAIYAPGAFWFTNVDGARLGNSVDIDGDVAIAGAEFSEFAYTFKWNGSFWDFEAVLLPPESGFDFADSVAVDATPNSAAGSPRFYVAHLGFDNGKGAVHVFSLANSAVVDLGKGHPGTSGTPTLSGGPVCDFAGAIDLTLSNMHPSSVANLVVGFNEINAPFKGGTLVPNPDLVVTGLPTLGGTLPVGGQLPYELNGFSFVFQAWIVDSGASNNLSATNALRIDFGG